MGWNLLLLRQKTAKNPMITSIVSKFQWFRNRLFKLFHYRAGATLDLIDALAATLTTNSVLTLRKKIDAVAQSEKARCKERFEAQLD